jgi:predicted enzyme related to lactoylglutathione lyase
MGDYGFERFAHDGGTVTTGPHEAPGGVQSITRTDPHGAAFALVGGKRGERT